MFHPNPGRRAALGVAGAAVLLLSLAACGEEESTEQPGGGPSVSSSVDAALAAKVPDAIKSDGKIVVGTDSTYAPAEFLDTDGKTVIGFDVELFTAVAAKLGLKAEFVSAPFGDIINGVNSGKYEAGVSSFTINDERKGQANMVSYFQVGTQWVTKKGNPAGVALDNACGKKIAVQKDTVQVEDIQKRSKACTDAGKPAITVDQFPGQDAATAAVVSGKDDAMLADYPVGVYAVTQSNDALELLDKQYEAAPYGYVLAKEQTQLAEAVRDATKAVIADGSYKQVLDKWKVGDGAITDPAINP
ncbi:ABC transporter substrate-binding protein [Micromonospora chalcea]|uniref:ABC transporter substrate-binding protein n=1 Tax=Micromonospora TaxID=1873 RepID=UPI0007DB595C|nr:MULTISPECIES: ABC transporter substrate-binding protein [Micromonospora]MBP1784566.1 polar amino acid transport system substrate-binding protein [Micromonospora sp. HB375]MBQ1064979.1 ABC transporter substrate-binding protein [Micromonospora sp. C41]MDH6471668.1 polar amino acid transport system substrate-binding protein [Micromonospora sp. H404/HB375]WDQ02477.1 ABC transporter substrate-binding protein [Micromonospora chalcea]